jgi:HK97 gp10 family phage protein
MAKRSRGRGISKQTVVGTKNILQELNKFGIKADDNLEEITLEVAEIIRQAVVKRTPVRTGRLKRSISKEVLERKKGHVVVGVGPKPGAQVDSFYALFLEFGTQSYEITTTGRSGGAKALKIDENTYRSSARVPGITARPFMRPAFDENIDRAIAEAAQAFKQKMKL